MLVNEVYSMESTGSNTGPSHGQVGFSRKKLIFSATLQ